MGPNAGAAASDPIRPTVGGDAMCHGQAGDLELNAVDGEGGHEVGLVAVCIVQGQGAGVNTPTTPGTPQHRLHRSGRWCHSRCGSHPTDHAPSQRMPLGASEWSRSQGW